MDFKSKIRTRLITAVIYVFVGSAVVLAQYFGFLKNDLVFSFGALLAAIGIMKIIQYARIIKNPDKMHSREVAETDERNVEIALKARSLAFIIYIFAAGLTVMGFLILGRVNAQINVLAYSVCFLVFVYWICYFVIQRRS